MGELQRLVKAPPSHPASFKRYWNHCNRRIGLLFHKTGYLLTQYLAQSPPHDHIFLIFKANNQ